ncbi:MAG TPA: prepilin-type N-terminal cleavage/methylation domain-containing protein [Polyangiaceae bacterium]
MPESSGSATDRPPQRPRKHAARGFTLIELVVVVVIIGLLAALATPAISAQMRDRRANQASQELANFYRGARMRALGRGSAVLVRYQKDATAAPAGSLQVWEAVAGEDGACGPIPRKGCQAFGAPGDEPDTQQLINQFNPGIRGEYDGVDITMLASAGDDEIQYLDVCFTPMGATFTRTDPEAVMERMKGVHVAQVTRQGLDNIRRDVLILSGGSARVKGKFVQEAAATEDAEGDEGTDG